MEPDTVTPRRRRDSAELNEQGKRTDESPRSHCARLRSGRRGKPQSRCDVPISL